MDEVVTTQNSRGNWTVVIPNMGQDDLRVQIAKLEKNLSFDEDVQALIDVLWDVLHSMQQYNSFNK